MGYWTIQNEEKSFVSIRKIQNYIYSHSEAPSSVKNVLRFSRTAVDSLVQSQVQKVKREFSQVWEERNKFRDYKAKDAIRYPAYSWTSFCSIVAGRVALSAAANQFYRLSSCHSIVADPVRLSSQSIVIYSVGLSSQRIAVYRRKNERSALHLQTEPRIAFPSLSITASQREAKPKTAQTIRFSTRAAEPETQNQDRTENRAGPVHGQFPGALPCSSRGTGSVLRRSENYAKRPGAEAEPEFHGGEGRFKGRSNRSVGKTPVDKLSPAGKLCWPLCCSDIASAAA
jgi:hypothetical protein